MNARVMLQPTCFGKCEKVFGKRNFSRPRHAPLQIDIDGIGHDWQTGRRNARRLGDLEQLSTTQRSHSGILLRGHRDDLPRERQRVLRLRELVELFAMRAIHFARHQDQYEQGGHHRESAHDSDTPPTSRRVAGACRIPQRARCAHPTRRTRTIFTGRLLRPRRWVHHLIIHD